MTPRRLILVALVAAVFTALALSPLVLRTLSPTAATIEEMVYWQAPPFSLTTSDGETLTKADLDGRYWIATFGFTNCPGICPTMTAEMKRLHDRYANEERVHYLFISVDPTNDTPEVMAAYAEQYEADTTRWHFLTGAAEHIQALSAQGFKVGTVENPMTHSSRFVLVGPDGWILGFYDSLDAEHLADLVRTLDAALAEEG